ncbi:16S rRNA (cytosine(1402)-N(4))-methyltransferase RsmH [Neisseria sp. Ec49-e6-T10]|uniref:16S rRNA (cytosine(1402)-N(4))-methyltransferase RsmH n=1 Tax=Neisseria sp. Ec49-e6-T10 TaxID=3140744 RepID=UPI003EBBB2DF
MSSLTHVTVLLQEAVTALAIKPDGIYVDATFGRGGHSRLILQALGQDGRLIVFDKDPRAIDVAQKLAQEDSRVTVVHQGFGYLKKALNELGVEQLDGALFDLGISSPQIDEAQRGFSFRFDAPLDMRMDTSKGQTAKDWLNDAPEHDIQEVIKNYGEERFSRQIAAAIVARRQQKPIETTLELSELVSQVVRTRERGQNPATRTFQAIRILINKELEELEQVLPQVCRMLAPNGRLAIISFHSLEDRIVKQFFKKYTQAPVLPKWVLVKEKDLPVPPLKLEGKAQEPTQLEVQNNPRARSARLRVVSRTTGAWED